MTKLTIVANIDANPDQIDVIRQSWKSWFRLRALKKAAFNMTCTATTTIRRISYSLRTGSRVSCGRPT